MAGPPSASALDLLDLPCELLSEVLTRLSEPSDLLALGQAETRLRKLAVRPDVRVPLSRALAAPSPRAGPRALHSSHAQAMRAPAAADARWRARDRPTTQSDPLAPSPSPSSFLT
jgi:hypothetical protein